MANFFRDLFAKKGRKIVMAGLDGSGKTTILYKLKLGQSVTTIPTKLYNVETVTYKNNSFVIWDVGGRDYLRPLWRQYIDEYTQGLIYVVDASDRERIDEAKVEFQRLYDDNELMRDVVLLVWVNKMDLPDSMGPVEVQQKLNLTKYPDRAWYVQPACPRTGDGLYEGLTWLISNTRIMKKTLMEIIVRPPEISTPPPPVEASTPPPPVEASTPPPPVEASTSSWDSTSSSDSELSADVPDAVEDFQTSPLTPKKKQLFLEDPELPGIILSEPPRQEIITPKGGKIDLEDNIGASISIPENSTIEDEQLDLAASFSGSYEMPEGVESVSPAYLVKTSRKVEFSKEVDLKLQHNANLQTTEDCKDMVFLKASVTASSKLKFEEIKEVDGGFSPGESSHFGLIKLKSLFSWFKIGRKRKEERFYSARLYKAVTGLKVTAVFCMCQEHPLYTKHCDKVITQEYPEISKEAKRKTVFNGLIITSDKVELIMAEMEAWNGNLDRSVILKTEVDYPERTKVELSELNDFPPRIVVDLSPTDQTSAPAGIKVTGLKNDFFFRIANDCVPSLSDMNTQLLQDATKELQAEVIRDQDSDSPMVACARDMISLMTEVEQLLQYVYGNSATL